MVGHCRKLSAAVIAIRATAPEGRAGGCGLRYQPLHVPNAMRPNAKPGAVHLVRVTVRVTVRVRARVRVRVRVTSQRSARQ